MYEHTADIGKVIELSLPIRTFWELKEQIQEAIFQLDANDEYEFGKIKKTILRTCTRYATKEEDRTWLYENSKNHEK